jgi:hypothetical protein
MLLCVHVNRVKTPPHISFKKKNKKKKKKNRCVGFSHHSLHHPFTLTHPLTYAIISTDPIETRQMTQLTGMENKAALLKASGEVREKVRDLQNLLNTSTHMARQLVVTKDIEKLMRAQEKVHAGLQELVL